MIKLWCKNIHDMKKNNEIIRKNNAYYFFGCTLVRRKGTFFYMEINTNIHAYKFNRLLDSFKNLNK
jgi:hypothetical protein